MSSENKQFKKRKRLSRPRTLVIFGFIFLLLPFLNYFAFAYQQRIPARLVSVAFGAMDPVFALLIVLPLAVGVGLLLVKKWGWYLFLVYGALLIGYNIYTFAVNPAVYNLGALANAVLGCAAVFYFGRKDVAAPYMKMYPRGWRGQKRIPHVVEVKLNGESYRTRDVSASGLYIDREDPPHEPNDTLNLEFELEGQAFRIEGGVVRVDPTGVGVAFRGLNAEQKAVLAKLI